MPKLVVTKESLPIVLALINSWDGKLSWELLCDRVAMQLGIEGGVQRQSLSSYKEIQEAYSQRKEALRNKKNNPPIPSPNVTMEYLQNKVAALEAENERLREKNEAYKQRFVLWQYNAYMHGVRIDTLDDAIDMLEKPLSELRRRTGGK